MYILEYSNGYPTSDLPIPILPEVGLGLGMGKRFYPSSTQTQYITCFIHRAQFVLRIAPGGKLGFGLGMGGYVLNTSGMGIKFFILLSSSLDEQKHFSCKF